MEVIKPMTTAAACRLTDLPDIHGDLIGPDDVGQPEYFISHAWSMAFLDLLDCVFNHLQVRRGRAAGVMLGGVGRWGARPRIVGTVKGRLGKDGEDRGPSWTFWTACLVNLLVRPVGKYVRQSAGV